MRWPILLSSSTTRFLRFTFIPFQTHLSSRNYFSTLNPNPVVNPTTVRETIYSFNNDWKRALEFFNWVETEFKFQHSTETYNLIIDILGKFFEFQQCWNLIHRMQNNPYSFPNHTTFRVMFKRYISARCVDDAVVTFQRLNEFNLKDETSFTNLIDSLCEYKHVIEAQDLVFGTKKTLNLSWNVDGFDGGVSSKNTKIYNIVLRGWYKLGWWSKCWEFWDEMDRKGIHKDLHSYSIYMDILSKGGKPWKAVKLFKEMKRKDSMDSTAQTGQPSGGDWQEEVYQRIKAMKESYLPELSEIYQKIATKLQQHDSLPHHPKSDQLEKLKVFKMMLERLITFLQVSKSSISPGLKEKLGSYEKQIINFINTNRPRKMSSLQPGQLPPPHMHSMSQTQSQVTQVPSHENQMNNQLQTTNMQGPGATMHQNNMTSMQHSSLSGVSISQQLMSQIQSQPAQLQQQLGLQQQPNPLQRDMQQRLQAPGCFFQQSGVLDRQKQLYQSQRPLPETSSNEMAPKLKRSKLAMLVPKAEKTGIIPPILKDWRNEKTIVDAITEVNGLKLQVKGLESKVAKLETDKASLQEEVVNLKKTNTDLEVANHEYEVKAAVDFAAGFAEAIAQVQVLAPGVDVSEAHYTKEIRDGQLVIASNEDEGDGDVE